MYMQDNFNLPFITVGSIARKDVSNGEFNQIVCDMKSILIPFIDVDINTGPQNITKKTCMYMYMQDNSFEF